MGEVSSCQGEVVVLSYWGFVVWWFAILFIHLISCAYIACYAKFYWDFDVTWLSYTLDGNNVGVPREYFSSIAWIHAILALAHGICLLQMFAGSLWRRSLVFAPWSNSLIQQEVTVSINQPAQVNEHENGEVGMLLRARRAIVRLFHTMKKAYARIAYRRGFFGVNGRYFYVILICREIVETSFQTIQAIHMSKYLSSSVLNHLYVGLLVINCWLPMTIHIPGSTSGEAQRRLAVIVCDCALDLLSTMGVTVMIVLKYVGQYDVGLKGFGYELLNDDQWFAQVLAEARIVLVVSWSDLAARIIFSLGVIATTTSMKGLLRWTPTRRNRIADVITSSNNNLECSNAVGPLFSGAKGSKLTRLKKREAEDEQQYDLCNAGLRRRIYRAILLTSHGGFLLWGFLVLVLHVQASLRAPLLECNPKVNPMVGALPACFAVEFNCHKLGISGIYDEIKAEWEKFDHSTVVKLYIQHCPVLELPESSRTSVN